MRFITPVLPSEVLSPHWLGISDSSHQSLARVASSSDALPMGLRVANWELGFNQSRFCHVRQVLRVYDFCAFSSSPALPPCCGPLGLSALGKVVDLWDFPPIPIPVLPGMRC